MGKKEDQDDAVQNRRKFLKKAVATSTVGFATGLSSTGTATASEELNKTRKPTRKEAKAVFAKYASGLLTELANEGIVETGSVSELPLETATDYQIVASKSGEGVNFATWENDRANEYRAVKHLDDGVLSVAIQPKEDHAYAFYEPSSTGETYIIKAGYGMAEVGTDATAQTDIGTSETSCNTNCKCVSTCGGWTADWKCCVLYPCETDTTCSWNTYCDTC